MLQKFLLAKLQPAHSLTPSVVMSPKPGTPLLSSTQPGGGVRVQAFVQIVGCPALSSTSSASSMFVPRVNCSKSSNSSAGLNCLLNEIAPTWLFVKLTSNV